MAIREFEPEGAVKPSSIEVDSYERDLFAYRQVEIPSNLQANFVYDSNSNCIYAGYAARGLSENETGWLIQKMTWDSRGNCTSRRIAIETTWTGYLTADYA